MNSHSSWPQRIHREPVTLRVYDISSGAAALWSPMLLGKKVEGIWHTGGGIVKMKSKDVEENYGIHVSREHYLGLTSLTQQEFERYLISIQTNFNHDCYDLLKWNCNHFTNHVSQHLVKKDIPSYILDLPDTLTNTFIGKIIITFIKMFSETPAINSDAAQHPRQTLNDNFNQVFNNNNTNNSTSILGRPIKKNLNNEDNKYLSTTSTAISYNSITSSRSDSTYNNPSIVEKAKSHSYTLPYYYNVRDEEEENKSLKTGTEKTISQNNIPDNIKHHHHHKGILYDSIKKDSKNNSSVAFMDVSTDETAATTHLNSLSRDNTKRRMTVPPLKLSNTTQRRRFSQHTDRKYHYIENKNDIDDVYEKNQLTQLITSRRRGSLPPRFSSEYAVMKYTTISNNSHQDNLFYL